MIAATGHRRSLMTGLEGDGRETSLKPALANMATVPVYKADPPATRAA